MSSGCCRPASRFRTSTADFLLVNDAAAAQLGWPPAPRRHRRNWSIAARPASNCCAPAAPPLPKKPSPTAPVKQVFLTTHRPVRIADRNLLLSSSADISEQKAVEDQLFRSAYYDELTDLPTRRVIEHRANSLLQRDDGARPVRAGLSRHRQFQAHQRLLRPRHRRRAAGRGRQAARAGLARIRHAVADQRRRIPAAAQSDPERARGRRIHPASSCSG